MKRSFVVVLAALFSLMLAPVFAAKGTVAVLPAPVLGGAAGNGVVVTQALRKSMERQGFTVVPEQRTNQLIQSRKIDLKMPQSGANLTELRRALNADYLVYPRVLSVGESLTGRYLQANILINIVGPESEKAYAYTRQVGQTFPGDLSKSNVEVIGQREADEAAGKLLDPFYSKMN